MTPGGADVGTDMEPVTADDQPSEAHGHQHRDVSGGWLRPAVFGAMTAW